MISVVIATYNRAHYLSECLDSLGAQTLLADEIVVVDDGSSDGTRAVAESHAVPVRYYWQPNQGRPTALNLGLEKARGTYLVFFDDDDVLLPTALASHLAVLSSNPQADYSYGPNLSFDERYPGYSIWNEAGHKPLKHCQIATPDTLFLRTLEWGEYFLIYLQGMMIARKHLEAVGRFQTSLLRGQDYDVMLKLAWRYRGVSTGKPVFIMRNHPGGRGPAIERHREHERWAMWSKYDRQIILPYWRELPLAAYLPELEKRDHDRSLTDRETDDAVLERSRVMFSHGLFAEGVIDIELIASRPALAHEQWAAVVALVRHAANIEKKHYIVSANALVRDIGSGAYSPARRAELMGAAARGFYWGARRFLRVRDYRSARRLVMATARLSARRVLAARASRHADQSVDGRSSR